MHEFVCEYLVERDPATLIEGCIVDQVDFVSSPREDGDKHVWPESPLPLDGCLQAR
jgi:hypothetical protein